MSKSVLRWAGSKRAMLPLLHQFVPQKYNRYIEPFAGSACLFFSLEPSRAIIGDINPDLIGAFRQIRKCPLKICKAVQDIPRDEETYYTVRRSTPSSAFDRAVRFLYLNRNCFNGVYRINKRGQFNVPWGKKTGENLSPSDFSACAALLKKAELRVADFEGLVRDARKGDFVYLDPPYSTSVAEEPGLYGSGAFSKEDIIRLAKCTEYLDRVGAFYLLSFEHSDSLIDMLPDADCHYLQARRHVAGFAGARKKVPEILFTNVGRE